MFLSLYLLETNIAPENGWLEYYLLGWPIFRETHFFSNFFPLFWAILFQFYRGAQQASKQAKQASKASKLVS